MLPWHDDKTFRFALSLIKTYTGHMNRRNFLQRAGHPLLIPFVVLSTTDGSEKQVVAPLPKMDTGSILTAKNWNNLIDRVNELSERNI